MTDAQILEVIRELGGATTSGDWIMRFGRAVADHALQSKACASVVVDSTLLEPLTEDEVFRFMQSVSGSPRNATTARILARYWKTHRASQEGAEDADLAAMRMLWDDQAPEEKEHYRAVVARGLAASQGAKE